ncbi:MAG: FAD:protein FMN transferase [Nitrospirae bacterium]|nr:FAD:protein FMN transferase [Nitrospirota bacterium]
MLTRDKLRTHRGAIYSITLLVPVIIIAAYMLVSSNGRLKIYKKSKIAMDTIITLTVASDSQQRAEEAIEAAFNEIERLERLLSMFLPQSEVSLINKNSGIASVKVSEDTYRLIKKAVEIAALSEGAFDPTIGQLSTLWDFPKKVKPKNEEIKKRLPLVNYRNIVFDDNQRSVMLKINGMIIDLGAIAKGYTADRVVEVLKARGISSGIAAIAGDIKTFGTKPDASGWLIGIKRSRGDQDGLSGILTLSGEAVSTSGDYERFFIEDGVRYHHLLDPSTGYPAGDFQSVTVVNPDGLITDAMSTAIFVMGRENGMNLVRRLNLKVYVIYKDATTYITDNLRDSFAQQHN